MNTRLIKLQQSLPSNVEGVIITSPANRFYFSKVKSSAGTILITREKAYLIIDFRYIEYAQNTADGFTVILQDKLLQQLREICKENNVNTLLTESENLSLKQFNALKEGLEDVSLIGDNTLDELVLAQRRVKDASELALIEKAQSITDKAFEEILNFIKPGKTEKEVAAYLEYTMKKLGADSFAFETIAVSGRNSALPHGKPSHKPLEIGDFFTLDFGAKVEGYCSDMTRTVAIGNVNEEQQRVYQTVLAAQQAAFPLIKAGASCKDIDIAARDIIENKAGYKGCFGHGLGHSLGIDVHEEPRFSQLSKDVLQVGNVLSVEPGIYLAGKFGVRIEDLVVVEENGFRNLTKSTKDLIVIN